MKTILITLATLFLFSCASSRIDNLSQLAEPYDAQKVENDIPKPKPIEERFVVTHHVLIQTNYGKMVIGLYGKDAPKTVKNFLEYVGTDFYSGKIFHRVIPGFMIQGGGYLASMEKPETNEPIELELIPGIEHKTGTISMARTSDPKSGTSQFFICVDETEQLNGEYAAFGKLEEGIDVALTISNVQTNSVETEFAVLDDVPVQPVVIESMKLIKI